MPAKSPLWIVPAKELNCNALALPCSEPGKPGQYFVLLFSPEQEGWTLETNVPFVHVSGPSGSGYLIWALQVETNTGAQRAGFLDLQGPGEETKIRIVQAAGNWIEELAHMVLNPPPGTERAIFPLAMELGAAGKFIAQILKKIPLPYRIPAYLAVAGIIVGLGVAAIAFRAGFSTVPEPPNYLESVLPPKCSLVEPLPMTVELITQQTLLLEKYIAQQLV